MQLHCMQTFFVQMLGFRVRTFWQFLDDDSNYSGDALDDPRDPNKTASPLLLIWPLLVVVIDCVLYCVELARFLKPFVMCFRTLSAEIIVFLKLG